MACNWTCVWFFSPQNVAFCHFHRFIHYCVLLFSIRHISSFRDGRNAIPFRMFVSLRIYSCQYQINYIFIRNKWRYTSCYSLSIIWTFHIFAFKLINITSSTACLLLYPWTIIASFEGAFVCIVRLALYKVWCDLPDRFLGLGQMVLVK